MRDYLPALIAFFLLPLLLAQGRYTRRVTPRLPEAAGPTTGTAGKEHAADGRAPLRIIGLGESPVAGVGVDIHECAITGQLAHALASTLRRPTSWHAIGRNGITVAQALELLPNVPDAPVDIALVAFGVNDTTAFRSVARWRADMSVLLDALEAKCQPKLILVSGVPPVGRFPALPQPLRWVMGLKANSLDRSLRELTKLRPRTHYVPLTLDTGDPALMAQDGFHPSATGCIAWAGVLARECCKRFANP